MVTLEANAKTVGVELKGAAKINDLGAIEGAGGQAKIDDCKRVNDVKGKPEVAPAKLPDVRAARSAKWGSLKAGVESARTHLKVAYKDLASRTAKTFSRWMIPPHK